jgi:hypothetical protein
MQLKNHLAIEIFLNGTENVNCKECGDVNFLHRLRVLSRAC